MIHDPPGICPSSPFKLLGSYVEADVDIFGGREQEIFDITARLASRGMLVIYGPSGIGKTSLIQAGIFPHVRDLGWSYAYVRVLTDPLADLATALTQRLGPLTGPERTDVIERIAGYADRAPLLIAFDQFEEFFTRLQANLRDAFISMVADLSHRSDIDCRILFSLREDYFAKFDEFRRKLPDILNNSYRIGSLSAFGAREAITRPLLQRNIPLENRLIPSLLDELVKFDFDPAFLQILCGELVRTASERDPCLLRITAADFSALGGIEGIFDRYLDNALNDLPADKRLLARLVLDVLISPDRIKHAMRPDDFLTERFVVTIEELTTILNTLCNHHIVRHDPRGDAEWFELVHERLIPIIQHWVRIDADYFNFVTARDLVEFGARRQVTQVLRRNPEALLNRGQIEHVIGPYTERLRLEQEKVEFVFLSCVYRDSSAVNYWEKRCGRQRAMDLLLAAMTSDNDLMRLGAVAAVKRLDTPPPREVLDACVALSLNDSSAAVRRMAGAALGLHAEERDMAALGNALRRDDTRARALEVCADVLGSGRALVGIGALDAFRARSIVRRRQLRNYREQRLHRVQAGMLYGIGGGVVWSLTVGPLWLLTSILLMSPNQRYQLLAYGMAVTFPLACIFGGLLGRSAAASAARRDALGRRQNWPAELLSTPVIWAVIFIYIALIAVFAVRWQEADMPPLSPAQVQALVMLFLAPLIYFLVAPAIAVGVGKECIWHDTRRAAVAFWGGLATATIPGVIAAAELYILYVIMLYVDEALISPDDVSGFYVICILLTVLGTGTAAIALSSLAFPRLQLPFLPAAGQSVPNRPTDRMMRMLSARSILLVGLVAIFGTIWHEYGIGTLGIERATSLSEGNDGDISGWLASGPLAGEYWRVDLRAGKLEALRFTDISPHDVSIYLEKERVKEETVLAADQLLHFFVQKQPSAGRGPLRYDIKVTRRLIAEASSLALSGDETPVRAVWAAREPGFWALTIRGAPGKQDKAVVSIPFVIPVVNNIASSDSPIRTPAIVSTGKNGGRERKVCLVARGYHVMPSGHPGAPTPERLRSGRDADEWEITMDLATDKVELTMRLDKNVDKSSLDRCGSSSRTLSSLPETEKSGRNPASAYESISDLETILLAHPARSPP